MKNNQAIFYLDMCLVIGRFTPMLKLSLLKQYSKQVVTSPIKAVRCAIGSVSSKLESSPVQDTFIKTHNDIFKTNPKNVINGLIHNKTLAMGKDAVVFPLPLHDDMVIRIEKSAIAQSHKIPARLKLVPIKHEEKVLAQQNLGLPLYAVVGKDSELASKEFLTPLEALSQKNNIMLLRKVTGKHPASEVYNVLMDLMGTTFENPDCRQYINFNQLGKIRAKYGVEGARKCIEVLKQGGEQTIPKGFFAPNSEEVTFTNCEKFIDNHAKFVKTYLSYLKDVAKMPKKAYKEAVDTILMDKNFLIDFQHTNNTFVDFKHQKFNFMDFEFNKSNKKYIYDNPVKEFRNVLTGKNFSKPVKHPSALIFDEKELEQGKKYFDKITEKVNSVTPDEYKI